MALTMKRGIASRTPLPPYAVDEQRATIRGLRLPVQPKRTRNRSFVKAGRMAVLSESRGGSEPVANGSTRSEQL